MASWIDYDDDNDQDLLVIPWNDNCWSCQYQVEMYQNNGTGTFTRISNNLIASFMTQGNGITWGDYDNNGKLDLFVSRYQMGPNNLLFRTENNGTITQITTGSIVNDGINSLGCAWADYDRDGWLDLFVSRGFNQNNLLYKNNGNGTFTRILSGSIVNDGGASRYCAWGDYDNDSWPAFFVVNYDAQNDFLYHNNGNGTFSRILNGPMVNDGAYGSSCNWVDYDNDGRLDLFVTNNNSNNRLFHNDGNGNFSLSNLAPSQDAGYYYLSNWADFDNDGWIDLFIPGRTGPNILYKNNNGTSFTKITNESVGQDGGTCDVGVWGDYNNDGKMDLFVSNGGSSNYTNYLYQNVYNQGNYLTIKLIGCTQNKSAIGAKIKLVDGSYSAIRVVSGGNGSQNMLWQHFGLGSINNIDSVIVYWTTGNIQILTNVGVNQRITIEECNIGIVPNIQPVKYELKQNYPNPFNPITTIEYSLLKSSNVIISIYDISGKLIKTLVNEHQTQGVYRLEFDGTNYASGSYLYKIETDEFSDIKKMVLLK